MQEATSSNSSSSRTIITEPPIVLSDETFLHFKNPWCNACNIAATHAIRIKQVLGIKKQSDRFPGVPCCPAKLPVGMRIMHDTYLFIYLVANFLAVLLARSVSPDISPTQAFRHDCLIRLYTSYLIYTLATKLYGDKDGRKNPFGTDISFEHWHMFYFSDLQLWERQLSSSLVQSPFVMTNLRYSNNNAGTPSAAAAASWHNFGPASAANAPMAYGEQMSAIEIVHRVTQVVIRHWYVLDIHLTSKNKLDKVKAKDHWDFHRWLPWKRDANRTVYNVTTNPAANLAPAPFCCIPDADFFKQNYDESVSGPTREPYMQSFQIPLSLFFHRLYVNMDMHFSGRQDLHKAMAQYLPDLYMQLEAVHWEEMDTRTRNMLYERLGQEQVAKERRLPSLGGI